MDATLDIGTEAVAPNLAQIRAKVLKSGHAHKLVTAIDGLSLSLFLAPNERNHRVVCFRLQSQTLSPFALFHGRQRDALARQHLGDVKALLFGKPMTLHLREAMHPERHDAVHRRTEAENKFVTRLAVDTYGANQVTSRCKARSTRRIVPVLFSTRQRQN